MSQEPYMPEVDTECDIVACFNLARQISANENGALSDEELQQRGVSIITPGRMIMPVLSPPPGSANPEMLEDILQIVPDEEITHIIHTS